METLAFVVIHVRRSFSDISATYPRKSDNDVSAIRGTSLMRSSSEIGAATTVVAEEPEDVDLAEAACEEFDEAVDFPEDDFEEEAVAGCT